jgi:hypothetical protein
MNADKLRKHWHVLFNEMKERWPELTQSDIEFIHGDKGRLVEVVKIRRHVSANEALRDVDYFIDHTKLRESIGG